MKNVYKLYTDKEDSRKNYILARRFSLICRYTWSIHEGPFPTRKKAKDRMLELMNV
jgi:hypothetical protein